MTILHVVRDYILLVKIDNSSYNRFI